MKYIQSFLFITLLLFGAGCNGPDAKSLTKEKEHPKLIKTIGSLNYGNVQCILQDKTGHLWFGTTENGLYRYDGKSFTRFLRADGLMSNNIFCMLEDRDGKIWIGTDIGLCLYDGKTFAKIQIPLPKNFPPNKNDLYRNSHWVFSIMQAKNGQLWFATIDGVFIYDGKSLSTGEADFTPFVINEGSGGYCSTNNNVEHILEDKAGNIWFGGRGNDGVYRYDGKSVINIKLKKPGSIADTIRNGRNWAWPQLQDKDGNIWFSNWDGAWRYDGKSFTRFTKKDGLSGDVVTRIIEDKIGDLWIGGDGISRYDGTGFTRFTAKDGLTNPSVWSILEDTNGNLWVGTRATGLYFFDGETFISYSEYKQ